LDHLPATSQGIQRRRPPGHNKTTINGTKTGKQHQITFPRQFRAFHLPIGNAGIGHLRNLGKIELLEIGGTFVSDEAGPQIGKLKELKSLDLGATRFTDRGMAHLEGLVNLESFILPQSISDAGMRHVKPLRNLRMLYLANTRVTDKGLLYLAGHDKLEFITLYGTLVTDGGARRLAELKGLKEVVLAQTRVTQAGVDALRRAHPRIYIQWPL